MHNVFKQIIPLIDLTSLNSDDTAQTITALCHQTRTQYGDVAALCVYPQFVTLAKQLIPNIKIATVVNFPAGNDDLASTLIDIDAALKLGADEIDLVMPYQYLLKDDLPYVTNFLTKCREATPTTLKIILEAGALSAAQIAIATRIAINCGADFIKTSTGKIATGATLEAAKIILEEISKLNPNCGIKLSGGIKNFSIAEEYLSLIKNLMGEAWISPQHVRFGASRLLDQLK